MVAHPMDPGVVDRIEAPKATIPQATLDDLVASGRTLALAAHRGEVLRTVLAHGLALGAAGVAIGTIAAAATSRLLSGLLFQVAPTDLATFIAVPSSC